MTVFNVSDAITSAVTSSTSGGRTVTVVTVSLRLMVIAVGLMGNFLVCAAIATDKLLQNNTNYSLFSLATADFLVCLVVMPLNVLTELAGIGSYPICFAYVFADVFLCTASIVHMTVISMDRYFGLSNPFTKSFKSKKRTAAQIFGTWLITILITSPLFIMAMADEAVVYDRASSSCGMTSRGFMLYGSALCFIIPLCISAIMYRQTLKILNDKASLGSDQFSNGLRRTRAPTRKNGYIRTHSYNGHPLYKYSHASLGAPNGVSRKQAGSSALSTDRIDLCVGSFAANRFENIEGALKKPSPFRLKIDRIRCRTQSMFTVISSRVNRRSSERSTSEKIASEKKATRVLAIVFTTFVVCWCPFFFHNIYAGFFGRSDAPDLVLTLFLWLGYISSTINPLIYCGCNRRWRIAFRRIMQGQCCHRIRESNNLNYSRNQTYVPAETTHTLSNFDRPAINAQLNGGFASTANGRNAEFRRENSVDERGSRRLQRHSTRLSYRNNSDSSGTNSLERRRRFRSGKISLVETQKVSVASDKPLLAAGDEDDAESFHSAAEEHPLIAFSPDVRDESPDFAGLLPTPFTPLPKSRSSDDRLMDVASNDLLPPLSTRDDLALEVRPSMQHAVLHKETFL